MFWSLRVCLGEKIYTPDVHRAWICIYSSVLEVVIPEALRCEMVEDSFQKSRFRSSIDAYVYNESESYEASTTTVLPSTVCPMTKYKGNE